MKPLEKLEEELEQAEEWIRKNDYASLSDGMRFVLARGLIETEKQIRDLKREREA
jgi:hypothetical protein